MVWTYRGPVEGLNTAAQKSVSTALPSSTLKPRGVCCHELAMRIHKRREPGADHDQPGGRVVHAARDLLAAEEEDAEERRLEEEGEQALGRERGAEDVADEARVLGPVGAEGELHRDAGRDADGEVRGEELDPEVRGRLVRRDAALVVAPLGEHDHHRQPDADGHEDEVVADGEGELDAGQHQSVHALLAPPWRRGRPGARARRLRVPPRDRTE